MSKRRRAMAPAMVAAAAATLGAGAGSAPATGEPTLLGQWRFDEPGGQLAVDDGPQQLGGALGASDGPDAADPGRIEGASGRALRFDGDAYVRLPETSALAVQSLSTDAVVRADASPGPWRYLLSRGGQGCLAGSYGLYTAAAGGVALYVFDGARYVVSATARPADVWDGAWHHVAGTFDGRALRLFVDGRPVGEPMEAPMRIAYDGVSTRASFGQYVGDCGLSFRGDVDMVRLWAGARSPQDIAQTGPGVSPAPPGSGPLPAAAAGAVIPAGGGAGPAATDPRACVVRLLRRRAPGRRRTVVHVRVTVRERPVRGTRVVARKAGRRKVLAGARTNAKGRARLVLRVRPSARVSIAANSRPRCTPVRLRIR